MRPSNSRLALHAAALAVALGAALLATAPGVSFTSDEGAAIVQARMLEHGQGWRYTNPLAKADPAGRAQPFPHGDAGRKGLAPYAKHPLYPELLRGVDAAFGTAGMYLLSLLGTVLAALVAALIARRIEDRAAVAVLWITGLVSPLFFDSFVVLAHTLAAAAAGTAVLFAFDASRDPPSGEPRPRATRWVRLAAMGLALAVTELLRSEGLFLGPALAMGAGVLYLTRRARLRPAVLTGTVAVAVALFTRLGEARVVSRILGSTVAIGPPASTSGFLADRYEGFYRTWLQPAYAGHGRAALLAVGALSAAAAAGILRAPSGRVTQAVLLGAAAGAYAAAMLSSAGAIPGLLIAFPLVGAGVIVLRRATLERADGLAAFLLIVSAVAAAGVLLTQYRIGGGVEWGGRYFAYLLPLVVPVLVVAAASVGASRRLAFVAALVVAVTLPVLGVQVLRQSHDAVRSLTRRIDQVAAHAAPGDGGGDHRPVVVSTERLLPQLAWNRFDRYRWLSPATGDLGAYGPRLARAGIRRIVLVAGDVEGQVEALAPLYRRAPVKVTGRAPVVPVVLLERTSVP